MTDRACLLQAEAEQAQAAALDARDEEHSNSMRLLENGYRQQIEVPDSTQEIHLMLISVRQA